AVFGDRGGGNAHLFGERRARSEEACQQGQPADSKPRRSRLPRAPSHGAGFAPTRSTQLAAARPEAAATKASSVSRSFAASTHARSASPAAKRKPTAPESSATKVSRAASADGIFTLTVSGPSPSRTTRASAASCDGVALKTTVVPGSTAPR